MRSTTLLAGAALLLLSTAPPAGATYDGQEGRIAFGAFVAANRTQADIWSVRPDGQALRQLTDAPGLDICPAYSADGKHIAFCSNRTGPFEIWAMDVNGTDERQLTDLGTQATFPDFSPDGSLVAFGAPTVAGGVTDLWTVPSTGAPPPASPTRQTWRSGYPCGRRTGTPCSTWPILRTTPPPSFGPWPCPPASGPS